jgi:hypothetical protein
LTSHITQANEFSVAYCDGLFVRLLHGNVVPGITTIRLEGTKTELPEQNLGVFFKAGFSFRKFIQMQLFKPFFANRIVTYLHNNYLSSAEIPPLASFMTPGKRYTFVVHDDVKTGQVEIDFAMVGVSPLQRLASKHYFVSGLAQTVRFPGECWFDEGGNFHIVNASGSYMPPAERLMAIRDLFINDFNMPSVITHAIYPDDIKVEARLNVPDNFSWVEIKNDLMRRTVTVFDASGNKLEYAFKLRQETVEIERYRDENDLDPSHIVKVKDYRVYLNGYVQNHGFYNKHVPVFNILVNSLEVGSLNSRPVARQSLIESRIMGTDYNKLYQLGQLTEKLKSQFGIIVNNSLKPSTPLSGMQSAAVSGD